MACLRGWMRSTAVNPESQEPPQLFEDLTPHFNPTKRYDLETKGPRIPSLTKKKENSVSQPEIRSHPGVVQRWVIRRRRLKPVRRRFLKEIAKAPQQD